MKKAVPLPWADLYRWRMVPGWHYEVSDTGIVRNKRTGLIIRGKVDHKGYLTVGLRRTGEPQRTAMIHRLVLMAFVGMCPEGYQANHLDGDKGNNRVENLEWVTPSENMRHSYAIGIRKAMRGALNGMHASRRKL